MTDVGQKTGFSSPDMEDTLFNSSTFLSDKTNMTEPDLEGHIEMPVPSSSTNLSTLDEPVKDTVMRDLKAVGKKFYHVLYPKKSKTLLKEWDLWGPLFVCVFLSMMLQGGEVNQAGKDSGGRDPEFAEVFIIYWVGATVVTLNIKLLGGSISFFQSVCVLGYCVSPLALALVICRLVLLAQAQNVILFTIRCLVVLLAFAWSTFASTAFLAETHVTNRKILAVYPIFLFYFVMSWLIISHTG